MDIYAHPLLSRRYILPTPQLRKLMETVSNWVALCKPGGMVYGRYRVGKTWAAMFIRAELPMRFPGLPVFYVPERQTVARGEKDFFKYLLSCCEYALQSNSGSTGDVRSRLTDYLTQRVEKSSQPRLVLFLDETQHLSSVQFAWLADVFNELCERKVRPTFIFFGQPQLLSARNTSMLGDQGQIVARFMSNEFELKGLEYDQFGEVLKFYDNGALLDYPAGSGMAFTEGFTPMRYESGWRLNEDAQRLAVTFKRVIKEKRLFAVEAIPMEFFTLAVSGLLLDLHGDDKSESSVSDIYYENAVKRCGLLEYIAHTVKHTPENG